MKRVTGIGGLFFKCKDTQQMKDWYEKHLGLVKAPDGQFLFEWKEVDNPTNSGFTVWAPFKDDTTYFQPSDKPYMINLRVENLERLLEELKKEGCEVIGEMQVYEYGKFGYVMDPEGNKIELWEPVDNEFSKMYEGKTTH